MKQKQGVIKNKLHLENKEFLEIKKYDGRNEKLNRILENKIEIIWDGR